MHTVFSISLLPENCKTTHATASKCLLSAKERSSLSDRCRLQLNKPCHYLLAVYFSTMTALSGQCFLNTKLAFIATREHTNLKKLNLQFLVIVIVSTPTNAVKRQNVITEPQGANSQRSKSLGRMRNFPGQLSLPRDLLQKKKISKFKKTN